MSSHTMSVEQAGALVGISRGSAYEAARSGAIPSLRIGRRVVIPVARLAVLLGETPETLAETIADLESPPDLVIQQPDVQVT